MIEVLVITYHYTILTTQQKIQPIGAMMQRTWIKEVFKTLPSLNTELKNNTVLMSQIPQHFEEL